MKIICHIPSSSEVFDILDSYFVPEIGSQIEYNSKIYVIYSIIYKMFRVEDNADIEQHIALEEDRKSYGSSS